MPQHGIAQPMSKTKESTRSTLKLNFRKLRQDFSPNVLVEGRKLYEKQAVNSLKLINLSHDSLKLTSQVTGNYDNSYTCEVEIDRVESETIDANCDCSYRYDCAHLAAALYHLEENLNAVVVAFSKETDVENAEEIDEDEREVIKATIEEAASSLKKEKNQQFQSEILQECIDASQTLSSSPFFLNEKRLMEDKAELAIVFSYQSEKIFDHKNSPEIQLALRLPFRSKPLNVPNIRHFIEGVRYREPFLISGKNYLFTLASFDQEAQISLKMIRDHAFFPEAKGERQQRVAQIDSEAFGTLLAQVHDWVTTRLASQGAIDEEEDDEHFTMPALYCGALDQPLRFSVEPAKLRFQVEYLEIPAPKIFLKPLVQIKGTEVVEPSEAHIFESAKPGVIVGNTYYRFSPVVKRKHLRQIAVLRDLIIPEPLFGTFVENSLPEMLRYAEIANLQVIERLITLPYTGKVEARCEINYLDGELEAGLFFIYEDIDVPAAPAQLTFQHVTKFVTDEGILARNLTEERRITEALFQDFVYNKQQGLFVVKTEKKIVEFMTEIVPQNKDCVEFICPENLLEQFIYDKTTFKLHFEQSEQLGCYEVHLKVNGHLKGVSLDLLWECIGSKKTYIELTNPEKRPKKGPGRKASRASKILVLDLEKLTPVVQIFDEIGLKVIDNLVEHRPLWSLASFDEQELKELPIKFSMSKGLSKVRDEMLGLTEVKTSPIPKEIKAELRSYQMEGVHWLERLRTMYLNGILADDMGLGKTLQAISAVTQDLKENKKHFSLVICPTSLTYNWKEEFSKFNPKIKTLLIDGTPAQRKKLIAKVPKHQVVITSYSLLQKDVEHYKELKFSYIILDEAQHIKNRTTRNAKSVKCLQAAHRLILTGTPIENSLDELWSLFDFLMPGLLSSYDRFVDKYIRNPSNTGERRMDELRKKVAPFVLRRMKEDVLKDLPPVSHIVYHCHLTDVQQELYRSYARSAREELSKLVEKEGFDKVQIHVLATLTRLKQICCHPAIFAKEKAELGDSAKFDMLMELLPTLIEGKHKTVIFSQYTRMLDIMRKEFHKRGINFSYLDGSSKNRLDIVNQFNEDPNLPVFLVSLKAGGAGLNLVGADTVILFDLWWNPAVENQAVDRLHRLGQTKNVSSFKFITLNTIEEKILEIQNRKRGLVKSIVSDDDEALAKLTWDEILELLQY